MISFLLVLKVVSISQVHFGALKIYYIYSILWNHKIFFSGAQQHHSNNMKGEKFANHTFFWDTLYSVTSLTSLGLHLEVLLTSLITEDIHWHTPHRSKYWVRPGLEIFSQMLLIISLISQSLFIFLVLFIAPLCLLQ